MVENHLDKSNNVNDKKVDIKLTFIKGLKKGLSTTVFLGKIIIPVYFFITLLKYTGILSWISTYLAPIMGIFGLPGDAAIALVFGNFVNIYAALAVISGLSLTSKEITILAVMLSFSHSLFMETAVAKKTGLSVMIVLSLRIGLALISGIVLNVIL